MGGNLHLEPSLQAHEVPTLKPLSYALFYVLILKFYSSYNLYCSVLIILMHELWNFFDDLYCLI